MPTNFACLAAIRANATCSRTPCSSWNSDDKVLALPMALATGLRVAEAGLRSLAAASVRDLGAAVGSGVASPTRCLRAPLCGRWWWKCARRNFVSARCAHLLHTPQAQAKCHMTEISCSVMPKSSTDDDAHDDVTSVQAVVVQAARTRVHATILEIC